MKEFKYIAFNKPYGVLTQFSGEDTDTTLANYSLPKGVYAAGRLDKDSEGLLVLTNDGKFIQRLTNPKFEKNKIYHIQVEGVPSERNLDLLREGSIQIQNYMTKPCKIKILQSYKIKDRVPPIRERKSIPTCWLEIIITEGKNRQVRRMSAKIGHPTLRLIRLGVGNLRLHSLNINPGEWIEVSKNQILEMNYASKY